MPTKDELLQLEDAGWSALFDAIDRVPFERRSDEGVVPGWSVKDLLWHCGYWAGFVGGSLERLAAGEQAPEDHDWEALNQSVAQQSKGMSWDEVVVGATRERDRARAALHALPDPSDEAVQEFSDETFDHYAEHAAEIVAFSAAG